MGPEPLCTGVQVLSYTSALHQGARAKGYPGAWPFISHCDSLFCVPYTDSNVMPGFSTVTHLDGSLTKHWNNKARTSLESSFSFSLFRDVA